jgi:hypothetical protein
MLAINPQYIELLHYFSISNIASERPDWAN